MAEKKQMVRVVDNTKPREDAEKKRYLLCIEENSGEKDWAIVIGRTAAYEWVKERAEFINFNESFILVETLKLAERKALYSFMKYAQDMYEDSFDIDDYVRGDFDEEDFIRNSNGEESLMEAINNNNDKLTGEMLAGGVGYTPLG